MREGDLTDELVEGFAWLVADGLDVVQVLDEVLTAGTVLVREVPHAGHFLDMNLALLACCVDAEVPLKRLDRGVLQGLPALGDDVAQFIADGLVHESLQYDLHALVQQFEQVVLKPRHSFLHLFLRLEGA